MTRSAPTRLVSASALVALLLLGFPQDADAGTAARKAGRGLAGITCSFLDLPGSMLQETRRRGPEGVPIGFGLGLGKFVARTLVGTYELLTAPFAYPEDFAPILEPEFPWGYFED